MVDPELIEILACPWCLGGLDYGEERLTCRRCGAVYAIVDDIPNMLVEEAELHCPHCAETLRKSGGMAICSRCGREWSTRGRLTDFGEQDAEADQGK